MGQRGLFASGRAAVRVAADPADRSRRHHSGDLRLEQAIEHFGPHPRADISRHHHWAARNCRMGYPVHGHVEKPVNSMPRAEKIYRRLPGRGMAVLQHARVYQGPDHLLQVVSTGYSEIYKRFYFRDIQAISIHKTHWGKIWNGIWGFF